MTKELDSYVKETSTNRKVDRAIIHALPRVCAQVATLSASQQLLRFGVFEINLDTEELRKSEILIKLPPQPFRLLVMLANRAGQVVNREEIQREFWGEETEIDFERRMNQCIKQLRSALGDNAGQPLYIETVHRQGYRFIAPVESKTVPAPRPRITESPSSATERDIAARVLARIAERAATAPPETPVAAPEHVPEQRSQGRRRAWRLAAALALMVITIVGGLGIRSWFASRRTNQPARVVATVGQRRSVAVLGLKNSTGKPDADWLSTALAEMLTTELGAGEQLRTIPDENVARMKMDLHLSDVDTLAAGTLTRVRKNLGTDYVVLGSYTDLPKKSGGEIRVDLRLQDTKAGETIALVAETGSEADLFDLVSRAGTQLREKLGVAQVTAAEAHVVRASLPSNPEAARLYAEGLAKLRVYDSLSARDLLERAVAADPQHALAHSALSQAWWNLGYDSRARDEAKRAMDQSARLSREEGLLIEGRYWETANQWDKAIEVFTTLSKSFPDNVEYGLFLAGAQSRAGKGKDALVTVEALRKLPPPARDDPRIDYAEQGAASSLSDFKHMTTAAETVVAKASAQGATLLIARGQMGLGWAFGYMGDSKKAIAAFEEAKRIFAADGDRQDEAFAINGIALVLKDEGDLSGATTRFNDAGAIFREIGNKRGEVVVLCNLSQMLTKTGDLAGARKAALEATVVAREIGDKVNLGLGYFLLGTALYQSGELGAAKKALEQTLAISQEDGYQMGRVWALFGLGQVSLYEGDLAGSRKMYDEGLAIMNHLGVKPSLAEGQTSMAELYLEEGRPTEAEPLLREAVKEFRSDNSLDDEAWACSVLARALLAEGKLSEAGEQINRAQERSANSQDVTTQLLVAITAARVHAAKGQPVTAVEELTAALAQARRCGFADYELEARLALGEIEMKSGNPVAARRQLEALATDARARGFNLIAHKALTIGK